MMIPVILESPYGDEDPAAVEANVEYARKCMKDCLLRGEAPFASHLLYTQPKVLDDRKPKERQHGINAGFTWRTLAKMTVVYVDRGISAGMVLGVRNSLDRGVPVVFRELRPTPNGGHFGVDVSHRKHLWKDGDDWVLVIPDFEGINQE
jgi:hypothetical protein